MASASTQHQARDPGRPAPRPLLPPAARPVAAALLAASLAVASLLAVWFAHQTRAGWLDSAVDVRVHDLLRGHWISLHRLVVIAEPIPVNALTGALLLACCAARRWRGAALVAVAVPAAQAVTEFLLKPLIGRTMSGGLSFPSGHTTGIFAFAATCAVLLVSPPRLRLPAGLRLVLALIPLAAATAVATALVALREHYFTDTVGGAAVAAAVVLAAALIIDRLGPPARLPAAAQGRRAMPAGARPRRTGENDRLACLADGNKTGLDPAPGP